MSQSDTLFIGTDGRHSGLDAVARDAFAALGITEHEERFSFRTTRPMITISRATLRTL